MATILNTSLFATTEKSAIGAGFHNIGSSGVLRASNKKIVDKIEAHYGERCGHIPLDMEKIRVLVDTPTPAIEAQMTYLSQLFGKELKASKFEAFQAEAVPGEPLVVVPYINVPEVEQRLQKVIKPEYWGIPTTMVELLKNKADFYLLADELGLEGFRTPDYRISTIYALHADATSFLAGVENLYHENGLADTYPLGIVLRAAESDGNYGSCLLYQKGDTISVLLDGDADAILTFHDWDTALLSAQKNLAETMNPQKETRVVISRFIDMLDSPGMSVVLLQGHAESLHWNGQLQAQESKACIGTSTYIPGNAALHALQLRYEEQTTDFFVAFLKRTAEKCGIDFSNIRGLANIDLILPGEAEITLQQRRKQPLTPYLAECNPRWTNYTDAIMTVIGANRKAPTMYNMLSVIQQGIFTYDKIRLPAGVNPTELREYVWQLDDTLKQEGTRIICRMTHNPMGLIYAGDLHRAQQEFERIVARLAAR